ncbi:hypothetical protein [Parasegetibacter sp. NRK P23]|uniref:hypothetical protein n=1 Tax=Parasegetibacter sp. NRK P23 TaxID=2942999 RepID=UPI0020433208|nr:hypothetical protein [Parasegetibacter sp. NRK P23]MCM5529653.1 hypothetical protein [Parasegetibacter sp. NRK P23]
MPKERKKNTARLLIQQKLTKAFASLEKEIGEKKFRKKIKKAGKILAAGIGTAKQKSSPKDTTPKAAAAVKQRVQETE